MTLCACGSDDGRRASSASGDPLLPFPYKQLQDPDDEVLVQTIQAYMKRTGGPLNSRFEYVRIDLDYDGRRDALVYLVNPYRTWCGIHGCTMLVAKAGGTTFDVISQIRPIRPPLIVSNETSRGWRELIVHVDGRWSETKDVALKYDGRSYPRNPEQLPALQDVPDEGVRVFH